ncbi:MAG: glucosaminidase domain-containing protein [Saprospiraceae bacterium]|nr:glucosaminidase domain-containing protein [Saprospiraceae bacterium]
MSFSGKPILYDWRAQIPRWKQQAEVWVHSNRWKLAGALVLSLIVWQKDLEFSVNMSRKLPGAPGATVEATRQRNPAKATAVIWAETPKEERKTVPAQPKKAGPRPVPPVTAKKATTPKRTPEEEAKYRKRMNYVERFASVAQGEMKKYGIPASITLAQGLLESSSGESRLSRENNNHFGIKCHSRSCKKGHCSNFADDSHKDFFRKFPNAWESFREHSLVLQRDRYQFLYDYAKTDYKSWARGLKKAGYATDPKYPEKLISLIESLNLSQYDRI